jgi:ketosteroid isomerase-like protein
MARDAVFVDTTLGERLAGQDAIRQFIDALAQTLSTDYRFELTHVPNRRS